MVENNFQQKAKLCHFLGGGQGKAILTLHSLHLELFALAGTKGMGDMLEKASQLMPGCSSKDLE